MKIRDMEIFLDILKTKSPTISAENFRTTQPNISVIIKNIETLIGESLFERKGKKLFPTSKALLLGGMWLNVIKSYHESFEILGDDELYGELNIASTHTIGEFLLPEILFDFATEHQKLKIKAKIVNTKECLTLLKNGSVDLVITEGEVSEEFAEKEGLTREILAQDSLIVACNDFLLASKPRYIDELLDKKWIFREYGSGLRENFLNSLGELKNDIPIFLEIDRLSAIKDLVINKGAISVFSKLAIREELQNKKMFQLDIINLNLTRNFYLLKRKSTPFNKAVTKFEKYIFDRL